VPAVLLVVGGKQNLMNLLIIAWGDPVVALGAIFILSATVRVILYLYGLLPVKYMIQPSLGFLAQHLKLAILYTCAHSTGGTWQKFKGYLGQCIDFGWAEAWEPGGVEYHGEDKEQIRARLRKVPDDGLKALADAGNQWAVEELEHRGSQ